MAELCLDTLESEVGKILLVANDGYLCALEFADCEPRLMQSLQQRYGSISLKAVSNPLGFSHKLRAYLQGDCNSLASIPVNPGGTTFQQRVWAALREIPPGCTQSYRELAEKVDRPKAYRAVGMANSQNPIAIVIPCHRVIGANGRLTGYAGGLERKQWLLQHEQLHSKTSQQLSLLT